MASEHSTKERATGKESACKARGATEMERALPSGSATMGATAPRRT